MLFRRSAGVQQDNGSGRKPKVDAQLVHRGDEAADVMAEHLAENVLPQRHAAPAAEKATQEVISCWHFADSVQCEPRTGATAFASRLLASLPPEGFEPSASTVSSG